MCFFNFSHVIVIDFFNIIKIYIFDTCFESMPNKLNNGLWPFFVWVQLIALHFKLSQAKKEKEIPFDPEHPLPPPFPLE